MKGRKSARGYVSAIEPNAGCGYRPSPNQNSVPASWLPALGWERIVQPDGVMYRLGLDWPWVTHAIMGPFGVLLLLGLRDWGWWVTKCV